MLLVQKVLLQICQIHQCFNTLYVVGSMFLIIIKKSMFSVSIHYMLLVQYSNWYWFNFSFLVSIHYMLLVQIATLHGKRFITLFQYIICCWFKIPIYRAKKIDIEFQYIICCWFKIEHRKRLAKINLFQYIICCWFNKSNNYLNLCKFRFNTLYVVGSNYPNRRDVIYKSFVSIHYMLLVQYLPSTFSNALRTFQYIICCWFKFMNLDKKQE